MGKVRATAGLICVGGLLLLGAVVPARAIAINVIGTGTGTCGTLDEDRAGNSLGYNLETQWVVGYMSGFADRSHLDLLKGLDWGGVVAWVDRYCSEHPLAPLMTATQALATTLTIRATGHGVP